MNILQVQAALTKLDDNQLKQEMLSPGMAPQFLVLSEMQRRKEVRQGGRQGPPPPQTTLKDEAMAQTGQPPTPQGLPPAPPQGIAALPEGAETAQGVQGFAGGGPVSDGRYFVRNGVAYDLEALSEDERLALLGGSDITKPVHPAGTIAPYWQPRAPAPEEYVPPDPNSILQGRALPPYFNDRTRPATGSTPIEWTPPGNSYIQRELQQGAAERPPYQRAMPAGTVDAQSAEAAGAPVAPPSSRPQWGLSGTAMTSKYPPTPQAARVLSDEASGRPVGLPALAAAPDPETVPLAQARRSTGTGPVPDISTISDRDLLSYWRSFQPSQLGIRSAASSPFSLSEIDMERARRAPQGSRPITSNQQFAGTGEEGAAPNLPPVVTASGTTPGTVSAAMAEEEATAPRQSRPAGGLPSLRGTTGPRPGMYGRNAGKVAERDNALDDTPEELAARSAGIAATRHGLPSGQSYREPEAGRSPMGPWTAGLPSASGRVAVLNEDGSSSPVQLASYVPKGVAPPGSGAAAVAGNSNAPIVVKQPGGGAFDTPDFDLSLGRARSALPDRLAGSEDEARRLFGGNSAEERKNALNFGLMEAGLRIMGSTSPRLAGAISEGGIAGLSTYRQGLEAARRSEKEGFSARMGIAAARAHQDAATAQTAGHLYTADQQAAIARGNNATQLAATDLTGQYSLAGHRINAGSAFDVANINAGVHREGYDRSDPLRVAEWVMAVPEGPEREARLKAAGRDRYGGLGGSHDHQLLNSFYQEVNRSRDDFKVPDKEKLLMKPTDLAAKERDLAQKHKEYVEGLRQRYARLAPHLFDNDAGAAPPPAPADAANPLGLRR